MREAPGPHCESTAGEEAKVGDVDAEVNERQTMKVFMGEYGNDLPKSGWRAELMVGDGEKNSVDGQVLFHPNYHLHVWGWCGVGRG